MPKIKRERTKCETTIYLGRIGAGFRICHLWSIRSSCTDSVVDMANTTLRFQIAGIGFANVGGERAAALVSLKIFSIMNVVEVVVPCMVSAKGGIVDIRGQVDWRTAVPATEHTRS